VLAAFVSLTSFAIYFASGVSTVPPGVLQWEMLERLSKQTKALSLVSRKSAWDVRVLVIMGKGYCGAVLAACRR
jgi:hypothetical protein